MKVLEYKSQIAVGSYTALKYMYLKLAHSERKSHLRIEFKEVVLLLQHIHMYSGKYGTVPNAFVSGLPWASELVYSLCDTLSTVPYAWSCMG